jgi:hypothetical protein
MSAVTAEQPSVEAQEILRQFIVATDYYGPSRNAAEARVALDSLTAALERAEREVYAGECLDEERVAAIQAAEARAQKAEELKEEAQRAGLHLRKALDESEERLVEAEAVVEAARDWVQIAENHTTPFPVPEPKRLRAALTAYDEPPTILERKIAEQKAQPSGAPPSVLPDPDEPPTEQVPGAGHPTC